MKAGWEVKALGEVATIINGGTPKSEVAAYWDGDVDWLTPKDMGKLDGHLVHVTPRRISREGLAKCSARQVPANSVIMSTRAPIGHLAMNTVPMAFNQGCRGMVPGQKLDAKYLFYVLSANIQALDDLGTGTTFKELSAGSLKAFPIPLPPLDEQKRIVEVLDTAFEGLSRARAHTETNLQNARELFEQAINEVFGEAGSDWEHKTVSECFRLKSGDGLTSSAMKPGQYPVFGGNGVAGTHDQFNLTGENVIIGRVGALCGNARKIEEKIWLTDNAFKVVDLQYDFDIGFLTRLLNAKNLRQFARQTAQPVISNSSLKDLPLSFPRTKSRQVEIARKLENLEEEVCQLQAYYRAKLSDLDALRQALLQKAFAGELT
ncbi:MAG: restriction endonuclease subunit S [Microgenomates group bacterium]